MHQQTQTLVVDGGVRAGLLGKTSLDWAGSGGHCREAGSLAQALTRQVSLT